MRRSLALLILAACTAPDAPPATPADIEARAREIHQRVLTIDTHDDIPGTFGSPEYNPCEPLDRQVDIPKMREGGLDVAFFIVYVGQGERTPEGNERAKQAAMDKFNGIRAMADERCPDQIAIAEHPDDVQRIHDEGKLVAVIGMENGYVIGNDISLIRTYYDLGGRYMTLAHTSHNDIADSSNPPEPEHNGLSAFGEQVVAEMNRIGMMVDVSHISKAAALHAMRLSTAPVIASHSSTRVVADHVRNMDDETLLALRDNGGVMQTVAFAGYVKVPPAERVQALAQIDSQFGLGGGRRGGARAGAPRGGAGGAPAGGGGRGGRGGRAAALAAMTPERRAQYDSAVAAVDAQWPFPPASVQDFVDHIDHAVQLIGVDHVGISSDFDGGGGVEGWDSAAETFNVTHELVRRGYSEEDIAKLWGGNLLRVWREVERIAAGNAGGG